MWLNVINCESSPSPKAVAGGVTTIFWLFQKVQGCGRGEGAAIPFDSSKRAQAIADQRSNQDIETGKKIKALAWRVVKKRCKKRSLPPSRFALFWLSLQRQRNRHPRPFLFAAFLRIKITHTDKFTSAMLPAKWSHHRLLFRKSALREPSELCWCCLLTSCLIWTGVCSGLCRRPKFLLRSFSMFYFYFQKKSFSAICFSLGSFQRFCT